MQTLLATTRDNRTFSDLKNTSFSLFAGLPLSIRLCYGIKLTYTDFDNLKIINYVFTPRRISSQW